MCGNCFLISISWATPLSLETVTAVHMYPRYRSYSASHHPAEDVKSTVRHRPFVRPSCVYGCWRERFRQRRGTIHQQGDLVSLCIHTNRICLNDTSFSMGHMKHVTQTHQHPTPTPLCCPSDSGALLTANVKETGTKHKYVYRNQLYCEGRTLFRYCFAFKCKCLFVYKSSGTLWSIIVSGSLKNDPRRYSKWLTIKCVASPQATAEIP